MIDILGSVGKMEITDKMIDSLVEIANREPIINQPGMNNLMAETVAQEWASRKLGDIGTVDSVKALAKIKNWDVRHAGFECIGTWEPRSVLIEMLQDGELAYSAATAAKSVGYSDEMRDALISLINNTMANCDDNGKPATFTRAMRSLASISPGDKSAITVEFLLKWGDFFCNDKYLFDSIMQAIDEYIERK